MPGVSASKAAAAAAATAAGDDPRAAAASSRSPSPPKSLHEDWNFRDAVHNSKDEPNFHPRYWALFGYPRELREDTEVLPGVELPPEEELECFRGFVATTFGEVSVEGWREVFGQMDMDSSGSPPCAVNEMNLL